MAERRKKILFGALTAVLSIVLTLIPAELLMRLRERRARQSGRPREGLDLLQPNPRRGVLPLEARPSAHDDRAAPAH
jgi:peptidoglycan/LPS O-acetylase OafA/YrhL